MVFVRVPGTILLAVLLSLAWAAELRAADVPISDAARERFKQGVALLKHPDGPQCDQAYLEFKAAYEDSPSPKILGNLGLCAMKLERDGEAIEAYERYLSEAGAVSQAEHRQIIDDLVVLRGRVARLRLVVRPLDATVIDERLRHDGPPIVNRYQVVEGRLELGIREGKHRVTVEREGYQPVSWELEANKARLRERNVELSPLARAEGPPAAHASADATQDEGGIATGLWVGLGITGAFAVATAVVGGISLANKSSFEDALAAGNLAEAGELRDRGIALNITTDVLLGATVVAGGITAVFLVQALVEDGDAEQSVSLLPAAGPNGLGVVASGAF